MKVEVREKEDKCKYPYIGITENMITSDDLIVLFHAGNQGICLKSSSHDVGYYTNSWNEDRFRPYAGEVVLINE
jgi:hypothetical protein